MCDRLASCQHQTSELSSAEGKPLHCTVRSAGVDLSGEGGIGTPINLLLNGLEHLCYVYYRIICIT